MDSWQMQQQIKDDEQRKELAMTKICQDYGARLHPKLRNNKKTITDINKDKAHNMNDATDENRKMWLSTTKLQKWRI